MNNTVITLPHEKALISRASAEPEAFAAIYDHYFPLVYNYIRYRIQDSLDTDDITAQVFERALQRIESYRSHRGTLSAWLIGIARNAIIDHQRSRKRFQKLPLVALFNRASEEPPLETRLIQDETTSALLDSVAQLPEREREILALKFGAKLTNRQIAELTGLSPGNVGVLVYRSVKKLRDLLSGEDNENEEPGHDKTLQR